MEASYTPDHTMEASYTPTRHYTPLWQHPTRHYVSRRRIGLAASLPYQAWESNA